MSDPVGLALVETLRERARALPPGARERLHARADALRAGYQARTPLAPPPVGAAFSSATADDPWRAALDARRRARAPRARSEGRATALVAEIRASAASARAADHVPDAAGPYNGAAVASRTLDELVSLAPGYVGAYVAWLEDLASLADLPERRGGQRKT